MLRKLGTAPISNWLVALVFLCAQVLATGPAVAQSNGPTSQTLRNIIDEVRPPFLGCPCNFLAAANWAGWTGPECSFEQIAPGIFNALLVSSDEFASIGIGAAPQQSTFVCATETDNDVFSIVENLSDEEVIACIGDLNQVGFILGLDFECINQ